MRMCVGDRGGHGGAAGDGQAAALAEVVLHVDDDQRAGHRVTVSSTGSPRDSAQASGGSVVRTCSW